MKETILIDVCDTCGVTEVVLFHGLPVCTKCKESMELWGPS